MRGVEDRLSVVERRILLRGDNAPEKLQFVGAHRSGWINDHPGLEQNSLLPAARCSLVIKQ